jgi:hypothetical protein
MSRTTTEQLIFVVHTDSYSGNFEREMTAFITGQIGDCGVGDNEADMFLEDLGEDMKEAFAAIIDQVPDEEHAECCRPTVIWPTPDRYNNGSGGHFDMKDFDPETSWLGRPHPAYESVAIFFTAKPTAEMIELMKSRAQLYAETQYNTESWHANRDPLNIKGFQLLKRATTTQVIEDEVVESEISI